MFWNETTEPEQGHPGIHDVVDLLFAITGARRLVVDHGYFLAEALTRAQPRIEYIQGLGIHPIHVAGSQNGWQRPSHDTRHFLEISRRTRLVMRTPSAHASELLAILPGLTLNISGHAFTLGPGKRRPLSTETTLFARHVAGPEHLGEDEFLMHVAEHLAPLDIPLRKALCGRSTHLYSPHHPLHARSLLLADLSREESIRLQQHGLGNHQLMGCGIFIPHKGIAPVKPE